MKISIKELSNNYLNTEGAVVVFAINIEGGYEFQKPALEFNKKTNGALLNAANLSKFQGKYGQMVELLAPNGVAANRIILFGLGDLDGLTPLNSEHVGGKVINKIMYSGEKNVTFVGGVVAANAALGVRLRSYKFDKYYTTEKNLKKKSVHSVTFLTVDADLSNNTFSDFDKIADGVIMARDLVSEPGNILYPESYAEQIKELKNLGLEIEILDEDIMEELGMESILGVGQGSSSETLIVIMKWYGSKDKKAQPLALVGKGVTFDTCLLYTSDAADE